MVLLLIAVFAMPSICFAGDAITVSQPSRVEQVLPSCGVAAVYAILRESGRPIALETVEAAGRRHAASLEHLSLADLGAILDEFGLKSVSAKTTSRGLADAPLPAVIYLRPERIPGSPAVGHFMVCRRATDERLELLDLTRSMSAWSVPHDEVDSWWDGECLLVAPSQASLTWLLWRRTVLITVAAASTAVLLGLLVWRVKSTPGTPAVAAVLLLTIAGCGESPRLAFRDRERNLGDIHPGEPVNAVFPFQVTGDSGIRVTSISTSCECVTVNNSLVDRPLQPGEQHELLLSLNSADRFGQLVGTAHVQTEPEVFPPIALKLTAFVISKPRLLQPSPIQVRTRLYESPTCRVSIANTRGMIGAPLTWDEKASSLGGAKLVQYDRSESLIAAMGASQEKHIRDLHRWTVRILPPLELRPHSLELKLHWKEGGFIRVPIRMTVDHPLRLTMSRLYFGRLSPGESRTLRLRFDTTADKSDLSAVASADTDAVRLDVAFEPTANEMVVKAVAAREVERFHGSLRLESRSERWPALDIPVTGHVLPPESTVGAEG